MPTDELRPDGTILVDFMLTNAGSESLYIPVWTDEAPLLYGTDFALDHLTLYLTSPGSPREDTYLVDPATGKISKMFPIQGTSVEFFGRQDDPRSLYKLEPNRSIRVHASSGGVTLKSGTWAITAHAELLRHANGRSEEIGTADAVPITKTLLERKSTDAAPN
jgi:hypothetical protein